MTPSPLAFLRVVALCLSVVALTTTAADPDLWGHLRFGEGIVTTRVLPRSDSYSFTSDRPWMNHEWLSESVMYLMYALAGIRGLVLLKLVLLIGTLAAVRRSLATYLLPAFVADALLLLVVGCITVRTQAVRPQLFSILLFAVLLVIVREVDRGHYRFSILAPFVMALWVNLHGGWIVGLGTLLVWSAGTSIDPRHSVEARRWILGSMLGAVLATLANPYGAELWGFLRQTVGLSRPDIRDWQPVYRVSFGVLIPWLILVGLTLAAILRNISSTSLAAITISGLLAVGSFRVSRLDAFFAIGAIVLLAPQLAHLAPRLSGMSTAALASTRSQRRSLAIVFGVMTSILVSAAVILAAPNLGCIRMQGQWLPEAEAGAFLQQNRLSGRMMTWFDWGEYAIWFGGPSLKVSMDGRRETVYSDEVLAQHASFYRGDPVSIHLPDTLKADFIWLPRQLAFATSLTTEGWYVAFDGRRSRILSRTPTAPVQPAPIYGSARCFPGP